MAHCAVLEVVPRAALNALSGALRPREVANRRSCCSLVERMGRMSHTKGTLPQETSPPLDLMALVAHGAAADAPGWECLGVVWRPPRSGCMQRWRHFSTFEALCHFPVGCRRLRQAGRPSTHPASGPGDRLDVHSTRQIGAPCATMATVCEGASSYRKLQRSHRALWSLAIGRLLVCFRDSQLTGRSVE